MKTPYCKKYIETPYKKFWVLFDLDNGHKWGKNDAGKGYAWIFSTKKEAIQHKRNWPAPKYARLSKPIKVECS